MINSPVMDKFREHLNTVLSTSLQMADVQGKELDVTIKMNISMTDEVEIDEKTDKVVREWKEPHIKYSISRKAKEQTFKIDGYLADAVYSYNTWDNEYELLAVPDERE